LYGYWLHQSGTYALKYSICVSLSPLRAFAFLRMHPQLCFFLVKKASTTVSWTWISGDLKKTANHVASLACRKKYPANWLQQPSSSLFHILL
jgi:hypothetical protein